MKILLVGDETCRQEFEMKFGRGHELQVINGPIADSTPINSFDVVFDFVISEHPQSFKRYAGSGCVVFLNTVKTSLATLVFLNNTEVPRMVFGFNGLPTFLNRTLLEVSLLRQEDESDLRTICQKLGTDFRIVDDRVGMVTPRIVSMIINEAFYTIQEGTATGDDIDLAMKLGTNYPEGPIAWCHNIGIRHVYELLLALYHDTHDERYKICALLKKHFLLTHRLS